MMLDQKGKSELDDILARYGVGTVLAVIATRLGGTAEVQAVPPMVPPPTMQAVRDSNLTAAPMGSELHHIKMDPLAPSCDPLVPGLAAEERGLLAAERAERAAWQAESLVRTVQDMLADGPVNRAPSGTPGNVEAS